MNRMNIYNPIKMLLVLSICLNSMGAFANSATIKFSEARVAQTSEKNLADYLGQLEHLERGKILEAQLKTGLATIQNLAAEKTKKEDEHAHVTARIGFSSSGNIKNLTKTKLQLEEQIMALTLLQEMTLKKLSVDTGLNIANNEELNTALKDAAASIQALTTSKEKAKFSLLRSINHNAHEEFLKQVQNYEKLRNVSIQNYSLIQKLNEAEQAMRAIDGEDISNPVISEYVLKYNLKPSDPYRNKKLLAFIVGVILSTIITENCYGGGTACAIGTAFIILPTTATVFYVAFKGLFGTDNAGSFADAKIELREKILKIRSSIEASDKDLEESLLNAELILESSLS